MQSWRTLGGVDEQSTEGAYPRFNQLVRKFGNLRGVYRQKKVMGEFLFLNFTFIVENIDEMINETRREKVRARDDDAEGRGRSNQLTEIDRIKIVMLPSNDNEPDIGGMEGAVEDSLIDEEGAEADGEGVAMDGGNKDKEGEINLMDTAELTDLKVRINNNSSFHRLHNVNTKIHYCVLCKQKMLQFVVQVHYHETHTVRVESVDEEG